MCTKNQLRVRMFTVYTFSNLMYTFLLVYIGTQFAIVYHMEKFNITITVGTSSPPPAFTDDIFILQYKYFRVCMQTSNVH